MSRQSHPLCVWFLSARSSACCPALHPPARDLVALAMPAKQLHGDFAAGARQAILYRFLMDLRRRPAHDEIFIAALAVGARRFERPGRDQPPAGMAEMTTKACAMGPSSVIVTSIRAS